MSSRKDYSIRAFGEMITDTPRMDAYAKALRQAVKPGSTVLDIGAGAGIFSLLACQFGAGHVYAVEPGDAIRVAQEIAAANGFSERITFLQQLSTDIELPQRVDVIISDLRTVLPLFEQHIPAIVDARQRMLASDGLLIPRKDRIWAALAQAPDIYKSIVEPWSHNDYDLDMRAGLRFTINHWNRKIFKPEQLQVSPLCWATLDYTTIEESDVSEKLTWTIDHDATVHGLVLWFDTDLGDGISFSNAPGKPELIYGQTFFPLQEPVELVKGEQIEVLLQAKLIGGHYLWSWDTRVKEQHNPTKLKVDFKQSNFKATQLTPAKIRKMSQ